MIQPLEHPYLIDGILPAQEVSILAGASGAGKSTLIMSLLSSIVNGEDSWMGHRICHPIKIGYIAADRTWRSYMELAARVGLNCEGIQIQSVVDDDTIDANRLERDSMNLLSSILGRMQDVNIVVVDPLILFLGCNANQYNAVAPRLIMMNKWCRVNRYTILGTHHATKARSDYSFQRPQDRISGSSALLGFTSTQLFLASADEMKKPYNEFHIVPHNAPAECIRIVRDSVGRFELFKEDPVDAYFVKQVLLSAEKAAVTKKRIQADTRMAPDVLEHVIEHMLREHLLVSNTKGEYKATAGPVVES